LFDLDDFGGFNEEYGSDAGDRLLKHVSKGFDKFLGPSDLAGRYAGQRFLLMMLDVGPRTAIKTAETIRQTIERTTLNISGEKTNVTACVAVTEVLPDDAEADVFRRVEEALQLAKKAGPNSCFFHDNREPESVDSPNLGAEYSEISL
jgi:diguanylate cyclase (GGDEF)-like protein